MQLSRKMLIVIGMITRVERSGTVDEAKLEKLLKRQAIYGDITQVNVFHHNDNNDNE